MALLKSFEKDAVKVEVHDSYESMGVASADAIEKAIVELLAEKEEISIVCSMAPSQYTMLDALKVKPGIEWGRINLFHVDEVCGLSADEPSNLRNETERQFSGQLAFRRKMFLDTAAEDLTAECRRYTALLEQFPLDIALLGFGDNGHIALDEPGVAHFDDTEIVKVVKIAQATKEQSVRRGARKDASDGADYGFTLTLPVLMRPRYKFCTVPFSEKAQAARDALFGPITEDCPASVIRRHPGVFCFFDSDSASLFPEE